MTSPGLHVTLLLTTKTRKEIAGTVTYINILLRSAVYINFVKKHTSNSGFDRTFMLCSGYFLCATRGVPNIVG